MEALDIICSVNIHLDEQSDVVVSFQTKQASYKVFIVLEDSKNLTWADCRSVSTVLKMACRGKSMTPDKFKKTADSFLDGFVHVQHAVFRGNHNMSIKAKSGITLRSTADETRISRCGMVLKNLNLVLYVQTQGRQLFSFWVVLPPLRKHLYIADCQCLSELFALVEPGDAMNLMKFMSMGYDLRVKWNRVSFYQETTSRYFLQIFPTLVPNNAPIDVQLEAAKRQLESKQSEEKNTSERHQYRGLTLQSLLKESGQAEVWRGVDSKDRDVAIKIFHKEAKRVEGIESEEWKEELRLLLKMDSHPNVIDVLDFRATPRPCLVTRFVQGGDLNDFLMNRQDPLPLPLIYKIALGIVRGVNHLHDFGIVHRDLKSPNILLDADNNPVIIDLGFGKSLNQTRFQSRFELTMTLSESLKRTDGSRGTALWTSPEMIKDCAWSDKTDIYSLGIVIWELFSRKLPFSHLENFTVETVLDHIGRGERPIMEDTWDPGFCALMRACWDQNPNMRPSSRDLVAWLESGSLTSGTIHTEPPSSDFRRICRKAMISFGSNVTYGQFVLACEGRIPEENMYLAYRSIAAEKLGFHHFERFWRDLPENLLSTKSASLRVIGVSFPPLESRRVNPVEESILKSVKYFSSKGK
uniref:Protein kinase domain-containing protein n=1 Tax=Compsopogon caeruleus TaxID=31354 RepID=A0A7S1XC91_9RHOD